MTDYSTTPNPLMPNAVDILVMIGIEHYDVPTFVEEALEQGVSRRISITSLPPNIYPGVSRVFCWHRHAIPIVQAEGLTLADLVEELKERDLLGQEFVIEPWDPKDFLLPDDFVPPGILAVTMAVQRNPQIRRELEEFFLIKWVGGVLLYSPLGKVRYILKPGEDDLPEHLHPYRHMIDAVRVIRVDDNGVPLPDQEGDEEDEE